MPVLVPPYGTTSYYCKRISTATDMGQRTTGISREDNIAKSIVRATGTALCIGETETRQQNGTQCSTGDMDMNMSKMRRIEICRVGGVGCRRGYVSRKARERAQRITGARVDVVGWQRADSRSRM